MLKPSQYDERELLSQIANGDEKAFERLFQTYHQSLGAHIYAITKSAEITEEIVQDCFLKIWVTRETLMEVKNFRTWLFVLSRNAAISVFRKNVTDPLRSRSELSDEEISDEGTSWIEKENLLSLIDQAITQLSPRQKEVFHMSRYKHMKYAEIAKLMGLSRLTVREHMRQALVSIRQYVKEHGTDLPLLLIYLFLKK